MSKFSIYQRKEHHLNHRTNTLQKLREMPLTEIPETSIRQRLELTVKFSTFVKLWSFKRNLFFYYNLY